MFPNSTGKKSQARLTLYLIAVYDKYYEMKKRLKKPKVILALSASLVLGIGGSLIYGSTFTDAYEVSIDGKPVAITLDKNIVNPMVQEIVSQTQEELGLKIKMNDSITFKPVRVKKYQVNSVYTVKEKLEQTIHLETYGCAVVINGETKFLLKTRQEAEELLSKVKSGYQENSQLLFAETVEIQEVLVEPEKTVTIDNAMEIINNGSNKVATYAVSSGDSLWTIAKNNNLRVSELRDANPELTDDDLQIGQVLKLVKIEPLLNVVSKETITVTETLPFAVQVEKDANMWRGMEKVKQRGKAGTQEVQYEVVKKNGKVVERKVLAQKKISDPVPQVVSRGTKMIVASRSGGSGIVAWPLRGKITSKYGRRWGGMHTGMDIDGTTGEPYAAAADGTVVFAGWDGGYGRSIVINHGNGLKTRYAHSSKILVKVGDKVSRGDAIGLVGNTGHSYGSHLHFEVIINGQQVNPSKYL